MIVTEGRGRAVVLQLEGCWLKNPAHAELSLGKMLNSENWY